MPLVVRFADLDIALRIEERWPGLNDRLASTVQFLGRRGATRPTSWGRRPSATPRSSRPSPRSETIDFRQAADPRATRKAVAWAVALLALVGAVVAAEPALSGIALRRLVRPFGPDQWPQADPPDGPRRDPPEDRPGDAVHPGRRPWPRGSGCRPPPGSPTRYPDGETATEPLRPSDDGTFRGRVDTVPRPFTFRVAAGDDVTDRIDVAVVPPPSFDKTTSA